MPSDSRSTLVAILALLLFFAAGTYVAVELLLGRDLPGVPSPGRVAIVPVTGAISSAQPVLDDLERFRENGSVEAFVLAIRSPGGTVGASQSLHREIRDLRRQDDRPVVAWIGDVGASGGYYAAVAADSLFALPGSITGSIGVIMEFPNLQGALEKVGVGIEIVKRGEHKDAGSPFSAFEDEDRRVFQTLVDDAYEQFVSAVAEGRSLEPDSVRGLADGRIYSGRRAMELGLVDGMATLSEAVDAAGRMAGLGEDPRTLRPTRREVGLLQLVRGVSTARLRGWLADWTGLSVGPGGAPRLLYRWR